MKKLAMPVVAFLLIILALSGLQAQQTAQPKSNDLTGTWEGEFILGTVGLHQPSKMVLEIVQVEGKMYCIVDIYPVDSKPTDKPNITYTFEGKAGPESIIYSLIQGRVVDGASRFDVVQLLFELKAAAGSGETLAGRWYRHLEPVNSRERGSGTFAVKRTTSKVSDRLLLQRQQKEILEKLEKQNGE